jgi:hypothetical protein
MIAGNEQNLLSKKIMMLKIYEIKSSNKDKETA